MADSMKVSAAVAPLPPSQGRRRAPLLAGSSRAGGLAAPSVTSVSKSLPQGMGGQGMGAVEPGRRKRQRGSNLARAREARLSIVVWGGDWCGVPPLSSSLPIYTPQHGHFTFKRMRGHFIVVFGFFFILLLLRLLRWWRRRRRRPGEGRG